MERVIKWVIVFFTTVFCAAISALGVFYYLHVDFHTDVQDRLVQTRNPISSLVMIAVGLGAFLVVGFGINKCYGKWTEERQWKATRTVVGCAALLVGIAGFLWILFNEFKPLYDQQDVLQCAQTIISGDVENFNFFYINQYPHQRGFIVFLVLLGKIFGTVVTPMKLTNLVCAVLLFAGVCRITTQVYENPFVTTITGLLLAAFCPIWIYVTYIYGTLVAPCLVIWAFGLFLYAASVKVGKPLRKAVPLILGLMLFMAICFYKAALIGLVAIGALALFFILFRKENRIFGFACLLSLCLCFTFGNKLLNRTFDKMVQGTVGKGQPAIAWLCMGLSSNGVWGPGSYDTYTIDLYRECEADYDLMKAKAKERLAEIVQGYLNGERSLSFFIEKTEYQWLDPNFGAMKTNVNLNEDGDNSYRYIAFYNSSLRDYEEKIMRTFENILFIMAVWGILCKNRREKKVQNYICEIYFIGGFIFELFWEGQARYCFPYFVSLFPLAAYGGYSFMHMIGERRNITGDQSEQEIGTI